MVICSAIMVIIRSSPFGGVTRTRTLIALQMLTESYARELSRLLSSPVSGVQGALRSLERDGLVAGRPVGRTRLFRIDPRYFARRELANLLDRLAEAEPKLARRAAEIRRRPRRAGKPLGPPSDAPRCPRWRSGSAMPCDATASAPCSRVADAQACIHAVGSSPPTPISSSRARSTASDWTKRCARWDSHAGAISMCTRP